MNENQTFSYKYSSSEQTEIENIVKKYRPSDNRSEKINQIRKLDKRVTNFATVISMIIGLAGVLLFGLGLSCILVLGNKFFALGIIAGVVGISLMGINPLLNGIILEKRRAAIAHQIIELSNEILKR